MRKSHIELFMLLTKEMGLHDPAGDTMEERLSSFRGHLQEMLEFLVMATGSVSSPPKGDFWIRPQDGARGTHSLSLPQEGHDLLTVLSFYRSGRRIYKIAEEFGKDLARANLDIPTSCVPRTEETVLIEFPDWATGAFRHADGTYALSVYVRQEDVPLLDGAPGRLLRLQFPDYDEKGRLLQTSTFLNVKLGGGRNLDDLIDEAERMTGGALPSSRDAVRYAVASYVYVKSGDPDLRHMRARPLPATKKEKKLRHFFRGTEGESLVDLTVVGYEHKKDRLYQTSETGVRGHIRLQPYGEGRTKIKVIWIDPHTRHYRTEASSPSP